MVGKPKPQPMKVYKALMADGKSPYQNYQWPLPVGDKPGDWVDAHSKDPIKLCVNGLHGYLERKKADDEGAMVFEMEIEGDIVKDHEKAAGRRGRLLRQIGGTRTITLGELLSAANAVSGSLGTFGVTKASVDKAIREHEVFIVDDAGAFMPLADYWGNAPVAEVSRRVAGLSKLPLKVQFA